MHDQDYELLKRYRKGDIKALETLIEKYRKPLYAYIYNMQSGQDADEIFQEVWLKIIRKPAMYSKKNFLGWIITIAHNLIIDRVRHSKWEFSLEETNKGNENGSMLDVIPARTEDPARAVELKEIEMRIREVVASLPPEQREVFLLRVQANMPFREIARIQHVPIGTVLARMQYALGKIRRLLKEDYQTLTT
jgi:RNA polymerase sigma-70 factor (ECF subfamily)